MSNKSILEIKKVIDPKNGELECAESPGAFAHSDTVLFVLKIPRCAGTVSVQMTIWRDLYSNYNNTPVNNIHFKWYKMSDGYDIYRREIAFSEYLGNESGLFYYHYNISTSRGDIIFPDASDIQLLLFEPDYTTPDWLKGGIIYHIFVDRFRKSDVKKCRVKKSAVINKDWDGGIPQYGEYPGAYVENNVFFGGNLYGIIEKLDYIKSLGANCIYLSPVFDAYSNHKYDTADFLSVDSMFGGDAALEKLIFEANKYGIKIILDGVFNHTGSDSVYFNKNGNYRALGAYQSEDSPYHKWYKFTKYPDEYDSWWGVKILPRVDCDEDSYKDFIFNEVVEKWMNTGIYGWRLDVADELSDKFLRDLRKKIKSKNPESVIIGEVWEDASNKIAYGTRKEYFWGKELDSVMNYPLRDAIIAYVRDGDSAKISKTCDELYRNYPRQASDTLMNILGTHDTERIMTTLAGEPAGNHTNKELSVMRMTDIQRANAITLLKLAYLAVISMPGVPCIFYGDETGMEGYRDPFCRRPYPWKNQDKSLIEYYVKLGEIRKSTEAFINGSYKTVFCDKDIFAFTRNAKKQTVLTVINRSDKDYKIHAGCDFVDLFHGRRTKYSASISAVSGMIFEISKPVDKIAAFEDNLNE